MRSAVLYIAILLAVNVGCNSITCRRSGLDQKMSCIINRYIPIEGVDDFRLDSNYEMDMITSLKFANSNVTNIPTGIFHQLEHVEVLNLSESQVTNMSQMTFQNGFNLRKLVLAHNRLTELIDFVFDFADNLELIDLSHNQIQTIGANVFVQLMQLKSIDLSHNYIKIKSSSIFPTHLMILNLDFNKITKFSVNYLTNIEKISLNNNELTSLKLNSSIKSLQANNNYLESGNLFFSNKTNLNLLSLQNNPYLNFSFIQNMLSLSYLDLSNNVKNVAPCVFKSLTNLKTLILKSVQLNQSDIELFSELLDLETLDISSNSLTSIDFILKLKKLKHLKLKNNNLNALTFNEFGTLFPELRSIDISENNWTCDNLIVVLTKLQQLKIKVETEDANSFRASTRIRGIQCLNITTSTTTTIKFVPDITTELIQTTNQIPNANHNVMLQTQFPKSWNRQFIDDQLNNDELIANKTNDMERLQKQIHSEFEELSNFKNCLTTIVQIVVAALMICVLFIIYRRWSGRSRDLYNNYNFPTIYCSKPKLDEQQTVLCA
jgi:Leucine-rich repeat (LRR) protein